MARTKSFVNLKNKLKPEVQVRKKTRVQPLKTNKKSLSDSSNTQNTDGKKTIQMFVFSPCFISYKIIKYLCVLNIH